MKGLGYLVSTISVLLLGMVAWPDPQEPRWKFILLVAGMATSIAGMALRWLSHRKQQAEMHSLERQVDAG